MIDAARPTVKVRKSLPHRSTVVETFSRPPCGHEFDAFTQRGPAPCADRRPKAGDPLENIRRAGRTGRSALSFHKYNAVQRIGSFDRWETAVRWTAIRTSLRGRSLNTKRRILRGNFEQPNNIWKPKKSVWTGKAAAYRSDEREPAIYPPYPPSIEKSCSLVVLPAVWEPKTRWCAGGRV